MMMELMGMRFTEEKLRLQIQGRMQSWEEQQVQILQIIMLILL